MKAASKIRVRVDPANPGQFFACCGLLEVADRLWGGAEGWYAADEPFFCLRLSNQGSASLADLIRAVIDAGLAGELSPTLQKEREVLEGKRRQLKNEKRRLDVDEEERRKELGTLLREGAILVRHPFNLSLDWWQWDGEDVPKTWAGRQEVLRIARAALAASEQAFGTEDPFEYRCVMRPRRDNDDRVEGEETERGKVEPFYFDARRGMSSLPVDIGFSPDTLEMESLAYPAVEFFCLVGLQRFRPVHTGKARVFDYYTWAWPLMAAIAPVGACGLFGDVAGQGFRFENAFRTDQRKHKAFTAANRIDRSNYGRLATAL